MITEAQSQALRYLADNGATDADKPECANIFNDSEMFPLYCMDCVTFETPGVFSITDTGRLRLEEFEGVQAADAPDELASAHARIAELEALLQDAAGVIAPVADAVKIDTDLMKAKSGSGVFIRNSDGDRFIPIETDADELAVGHLRAIAEFATRLKVAGVK